MADDRNIPPPKKKKVCSCLIIFVDSSNFGGRFSGESGTSAFKKLRIHVYYSRSSMGNHCLMSAAKETLMTFFFLGEICERVLQAKHSPLKKVFFLGGPWGNVTLFSYMAMSKHLKGDGWTTILSFQRLQLLKRPLPNWIGDTSQKKTRTLQSSLFSLDNYSNIYWHHLDNIEIVHQTSEMSAIFWQVVTIHPPFLLPLEKNGPLSAFFFRTDLPPDPTMDP